MPARSQGADQQAVNPFKSRTGVPTFPQCIWEVLVNHRDGLSIAAIVEELQQRGLRDVSGLKNPGGQVANNLGRHLDQFTHKNHLWGLRLYEPAEEADITVDSQDTTQQAGSIEDSVAHPRSSQDVAGKLSISSSKRRTRSSSPVTPVADAQLVGLACTLWWDGEQEWYPGVIQSWNPADGTYMIQYDDGDQETGAAFKSYSLEQSSEGQQLVKVHEFKPGNYLPVAEHADDSNAAPASAAKQSAADTSFLGDASEEDLPLSTLAERHPSQPKPDAKGSTSSADNAAALETIDHNKAPPSSKANSNTNAKARNSEAITNSQDNGHPQAENSAAEATPAPASQGSPEPSSAPPAAVQPRTTRSRSKRMSSDASPSMSIASKQSMQNEPEAKPSLTKPPSGRRKRSLTPPHPPAAAAASPAPAEAAGTTTTTVKTASAGKKRQHTPDTVTGAATKKPVASRRSSRLSATALSQASSEDLHHEEEDSDCRPSAPETALTVVDAATVDENQTGGGVQLGSVANDEKQQPAEADAGMLAPPSDKTAPNDTTAVTLTDAARATAAGRNPPEETAEVISQGLIEPVEAVIAKQPHSPVPESVGASAEMLHQTEHPTQADDLAEQHQGTSGAHSTAVSQEGLVPASKGHAPTDGKDAQVAKASTAAVVSQGAGAAAAAAAAADVPSHGHTDAAESTPLVLEAPSMAAGERPTSMEKASVPSSAAAAASITDASSAAQAANVGSAASKKEAQAPISAAAAPIGGALAAAQAANAGLRPAAKPLDTSARQTDATESCASADAGGQQTPAPDTSVSAEVPGGSKPPLSADALAIYGVEVSHAVPAAATETQAEAVESVASAHARPSVASTSAASQMQSAESPATATAAQATTAPPPASAAAAASATAAVLKTVSVPKPPQASGSTRIGLPNRLSSLSKSLLGPAQQKAGSTHIRPILSKGLTTALKSDRGVKAPNSSLSEGSIGSKRKRDVSPSPNLLEQTAGAKSRSKGSKQVSGHTRDSTVSPNEATRPVQAPQPSLDVAANMPASPEDPSTAVAASAHDLPVQQPHVTTALPHGLMPLREQLPAQLPLQLPTPPPQQLQTQQLPQLPQQGHLLVSQAASQHQQLQGSVSPGQQQPPQMPARVQVPLHKGVGLVRLCIAAEPPKVSDRLQQDAAPLLVAKYSAWPFTCLWPESPPSQPPPLPSQSPSPSPPPMLPRNHDPSHRPYDTQPGRTVSQLVVDGINHVAAAPDSHRAAAALPQMAQAVVAATALRPSGKQAPKVLIEPSFINSAGPFQAASKRQRGDLSESPDDGRFGAHRALSRNAGGNSRPESASRSASKADGSSRPPSSVDPMSSSKAASSQHRSHERRAPSYYSESQHAQQDSRHRPGSHRDAPYSKEQDDPRSSSRDFPREHRHDRYRDEDRSYHSRAYDRESGSKRRRSRSTSSSSRTSSHSRERQRHSSGRYDSRSYQQAQQPRGSYRDRDSGRDNRHQGSYHRDDRDRYSRRDRDRGSGRDRYDGSKGKQAQAAHSHGSRSQRPDSIPDRRGATDPPGRDPQGMSLSPSSSSKRSNTSSVSPDAAHGASLVLPQGFRNGRIFWSSDRTFKECMDKRLFAGKDERDIRDIGADTAVFLWNCFQRELHGVWVSSKQGNLEPHAFGGKFRCQARVREEYMFAKPLPIETVLPILPRIPGRPDTSFEQHLDRDQVCKVWNAFIRHNNHSRRPAASTAEAATW